MAHVVRFRLRVRIQVNSKSVYLVQICKPDRQIIRQRYQITVRHKGQKQDLMSNTFWKTLDKGQRSQH